MLQLRKVPKWPHYFHKNITSALEDRRNFISGQQYFSANFQPCLLIPSPTHTLVSFSVFITLADSNEPG